MGTFNVEWAFDDVDRRPKKARPHRARTAEDWAWKRDSIATILIAEELDVVTLTEIGGEREAIAVADAVLAGGGYRYDVVCLPTHDKATGQHVAVLSRLPTSNVRRLQTSIDKQLAVDIELPTGDTVVVVALHLRESQQPAYASKRRKAARSLRRELSRTLGGGPLLVTGTLGSRTHPYDDAYARSAPAILAARHNKLDDDDCSDSASASGATNTAGEPADHIISCGLELRSATTSSQSAVIRDFEDPDESPWPAVPVEEDPYRDVSDHYLVWAEIAMPTPAAPTQGDDDDVAL